MVFLVEWLIKVLHDLVRFFAMPRIVGGFLVLTFLGVFVPDGSGLTSRFRKVVVAQALVASFPTFAARKST
jgi:hypothetical protein